MTLKSVVMYLTGLYKLKKLTHQQIIQEKPLNVIITTIYYPFWFLVDLVIVVIHILIAFVLILPLFFIVFMSKMMYAPYSSYHPSDIISYHDLIYQPWYIFIKFSSFEVYIQVLLILLFYFAIVLFL